MATIGMQTAALLQFIAIMIFLEPIVTLVVPGSALVSFYGANGIVNGTYSAYTSKFASPVLITANSTTGFGAAGNLGSSGFTALAFIYGAFGLLWKSMLNFPNMIIVIFSGTISNIAFIPVAVVLGVSSIAFIIGAYITISNFWKFISGWQKTDMENIGN